MKCEYHSKKYTTVGTHIKSNKIKDDNFFDVNNVSEKNLLSSCLGKENRKKNSKNTIPFKINPNRSSHHASQIGTSIDSQQKAFEIKNIVFDGNHINNCEKDDLNKITKL